MNEILKQPFYDEVIYLKCCSINKLHHIISEIDDVTYKEIMFILLKEICDNLEIERNTQNFERLQDLSLIHLNKFNYIKLEDTDE